MTKLILGTVHFWSQQLGIGDKEVRAALEGITPDGVRGESQPEYYLSTVFQAMADRQDLNAGQERARKDKEMADKLALENRMRRGEVMEAEQAIYEFGSAIHDARARLIQLPDALGQLCDPKYAPVITAEARRRIYEVLSDLSGEVASAMEAAADPDGERVGGPESAPVNGKQRGARAVED